MSSLRDLTSSFSVDRTPTSGLAALAANSPTQPFHFAASGSLLASSSCFSSCSLHVSVSTILAVIASSSKLAFVIVVNRLSDTRWFTCSLTSLPSALSCVVTAESPLVTYTSRSCSPAVSGSLPQTPLIVHPVPFAVSWH